ncbi:MAG TPA: MFS transporter [Candidatus Saccharimonadales bacterium]|nr:MFS transporter [Candidatus Saccharimonadales bacterium]
MTKHHIASALRHKSFFFLWLAEIFSQVAMNMLNFILIIVAYQLTNSNSAVSGIVLAFTIPAVIFGLLAGIYVDRWDKKKVLFATNFFRACLLVVLAIFHENIPILYTLTFAVSTITQFFIPAETPIIPLVVKKELLYSANALFGIALYGAVLIAYGLSGPFLLFFQPITAFLFLAVFFGIAALCIFFVREPRLQALKNTSKKSVSMKREIKETFSHILKTKEVYSSFILLIVIQILILIVSVLGPGYARNILNIQIAEFPLLFVTPAAIGMVLGAVVLTNYFHNYPKYKSARLGLFLSAFAVMLLPYGSRVTARPIVHTINAYLPKILNINILHIMVFLAFLMGIAIALIFVPSNTIIQEKTTDELRGKIYGTLNAVVSLCSILPVVLVGSFADVFGVGAVLTSVGIAIACIGVVHIFVHL